MPPSETPWMRTREVMVHAVDLGAGIGFGDLPPDFLMALCNDVVAKRSTAADTPQAGPALLLEASDTGVRWLMHGAGTATPVTGTLAAVASYLCGRGAEGVATPDHAHAPDLPAWL